jgi:hypothetical protein
LNHDGSQLWQYNIPGYNSSFRGVALSDINNDFIPDVIFGTSAGQLIALNGNNASLIFNLDLAAHYGGELDFDHAPVVGDFNNNDTLDIFIVGGRTDYPAFQTNYGRGYAVQVGKGSGPEWPMFQYDTHRTGNICDLQNAAIPSNENIPAVSMYPNPLKAGEPLFLSFSEHTAKQYQLTDITGRIIDSGAITDDRIIFTGDLKPGLYILNLSHTNKNISKKILIY